MCFLGFRYVSSLTPISRRVGGNEKLKRQRTAKPSFSFQSILPSELIHSNEYKSPSKPRSTSIIIRDASTVMKDSGSMSGKIIMSSTRHSIVYMAKEYDILTHVAKRLIEIYEFDDDFIVNDDSNINVEPKAKRVKKETKDKKKLPWVAKKTLPEGRGRRSILV